MYNFVIIPFSNLLRRLSTRLKDDKKKTLAAGSLDGEPSFVGGLTPANMCVKGRFVPSYVSMIPISVYNWVLVPNNLVSVRVQSGVMANGKRKRCRLSDSQST